MIGDITRYRRINTSIRFENHDDDSRNAIKKVPIVRVKILSTNRYDGVGAKQNVLPIVKEQ